MTITVARHSPDSYAESVYHDGKDACLMCHQSYTDNSRNSKTCPTCRPAWRLKKGREKYQRKKNQA